MVERAFSIGSLAQVSGLNKNTLKKYCAVIKKGKRPRKHEGRPRLVPFSVLERIADSCDHPKDLKLWEIVRKIREEVHHQINSDLIQGDVIEEGAEHACRQTYYKYAAEVREILLLRRQETSNHS